MDKIIIGDKLRELREERDLSQDMVVKDVNERYGVNLSKQNRTSVNKRLRMVFCVLYASCEPCFILSYLVLFLIQKKSLLPSPR